MFEMITARELADELDAPGSDPAVVDTRTEESYASWHVPGAVNVPFGPTESVDDAQAAAVDRVANGGRVVTVCGKGATSTALAAELDANGRDDVAAVKGGMRDWNALYEQAYVGVGDGPELVQFQRRGKGCLSYLVVDAGEAVVVDPTRHGDQYVVAAAERDAEITRVLDTHVHADHVSGGRRLADRLDVPYHLGARVERRDLDYEFDPVTDCDAFSVGDVEVTGLAAPGHTSEMVTYRVGDDALLTGDALFLESVGRTELEFGEADAEKGARMAYETLRDTLAEQPNELVVLPGHVSVTDDGRFEHGSPGHPVAAPLGAVLRRLDRLELDREAFVERMVTDLPEKPDNYETIIDVNAGRETLDSRRAATRLETGPNDCSA